MLADMTMVEESTLPKLTDSKMDDYAKELADEFRAYRQSRLLLETEIWPSCDKSFMCIRDDMPWLPTMKLIDDYVLGESDIRDALKTMRNRLLNGLVPTDESFLEVASLDEEDDESQLRKAKEFLIYLTDKAKLRKCMQTFLDQWLCRGISAIAVRWEQRYKVQRAKRGLIKGLKGVAQDSGVDLPDGPVRYSKLVYNAPRVSTVDMYRLWFDPIADLGVDSETAYIYLTFKTMSDLKNARDPNDPAKKLYDQDVLEGVEEWEYQDYYKDNGAACESTKLMGVDPTISDLGKFVPVYLFYKQVREFEDGECFVDKFFYVARSKNNDGWKIIRVEDNPYDSGVCPFYVATCDQWLNVPYGTGLAEKSLTAWRAKNILAAIGLNMAVLQSAPPMYFASGVLKDERKPKIMPGGFQEIIMRPNIGMEWIAPFPFNPNNVEIGMQNQKFESEKILAQTGASTTGLVTDPSKSTSKSKTATEVQQESVDGTQIEQVYVDQLAGEIVEPVVQAMYDLSREFYTSDQKYIQSNQSGGTPSTQTITRDELDKEREVKAVGRRGVAMKGQQMANLTNILKIISSPQAVQAIPNLPIMAQDVLVKLISMLGLPMKEEYMASPEEIFAKEPQVMEAAIQNALQDPQKRQEIGQMLLQSPEGQQFIEQLVEQIHGQLSPQMQPPMPQQPQQQQMPQQGAPQQ